MAVQHCLLQNVIEDLKTTNNRFAHSLIFPSSPLMHNIATESSFEEAV